jgi:hypothetical protein
MKLWMLFLVAGIILKWFYGRETMEEIEAHYDTPPAKDSMLVRYYAGGPPQNTNTRNPHRIPSRALPEHTKKRAKGIFSKDFLENNSEETDYEEV